MKFFRASLTAFFLLAAVAHADPAPYATLEEFMIGLEITPTEEFVSRSSATPTARMYEWREVLLSQNPVHFERWNHKLREIPGIGFRDVARPWTLSAPGSSARPLGFKPSDEVL